MLIKERLGFIKPGSLHLPAVLTFLILHLNHTLLTLAQYSSKSYTFPFSDPTILNYLEGHSNQNNIFEYRGYPTTNLQTYHPGPLPFIYVFKLSWVIHTYFDINPIYLSNILLAIYPTLLIIIASTILYKNNLKLLSIMTLSITWLVQYTNHNFNASNRGPERLDIGTDYITLIATLTLMMLILSYKNPHSSHLPLLAFSGLLLNNHFSAFALAPFTILYALYLIMLSVKAKRYKINYKALIPLSIFIYLPLIYRFMVEPLYLYQALTAKTNSSSGRLFPDKWSYFYETTPLQLFINPCDKAGNSFNNLPCLPYTSVKISVLLFAILTVTLLYRLTKKQNNYIKLIIIIPFILINYNTATGFEPKHSSIATALTLSIIIYYLSKNNLKTSLTILMILLYVNIFSTGNYQLNSNSGYKKIEKENFSKDFIKEIKTAKFKIDLCYLTDSAGDNCAKMRNKKTLIQSYYSLNMAQLTILEMLKNKIDICIVNNTDLVTRIENLICNANEKNDKYRNELYLIRDYNLETPPVLYNYIKIATVISIIPPKCLKSQDSVNAICQNDTELYQSMFHPGIGIYLKKDAKGLDLTKLSFINNQHYEDILTTLELLSNLDNRCVLYFKEQKQSNYYCYKESPQNLTLIERSYKDKVELYDLR